MTGIYKIINNITEKVYIGQATNIAARWKEHLRRPFEKNYNEYHSHLYNSIRLYGIENFSFSVVEMCEEENLDEREKFWIEYYNSYNPSLGYNETLGGKGTSGKGVFLDYDSANEIKILLSETNMTQWEIANEFQVDQSMVSYINIGDLWHDDERAYPIRERSKPSEKQNACVDCGASIHRKSTRCVECATKERLKQQYNKPTIDSLENMLIERGGSASKVAEDCGVAAKTIRLWCKEYGLSYNVKDYVQDTNGKKIHNGKRAIRQIEMDTNTIVKEYESIADATRKTGITHIWDVCNGKRTQVGGYRWEYVNDIT